MTRREYPLKYRIYFTDNRTRYIQVFWATRKAALQRFKEISREQYKSMYLTVEKKVR